MVVQQDGRGECSFEIDSRLELNERIVFLGQPIDDEAPANLVVAQPLDLEAADPDRDISLYVNRPGDVVYAGLAIYDTMQTSRPTCRRSAAASRCRWARCCSPPVRRKRDDAPPNGRMRHPPAERRLPGPVLATSRSTPARRFARHRSSTSSTRGTRPLAEQIHTGPDRDRFMTPEEAVEYGLVDKIVNGRGV